MTAVCALCHRSWPAAPLGRPETFFDVCGACRRRLAAGDRPLRPADLTLVAPASPPADLKNLEAS